MIRVTTEENISVGWDSDIIENYPTLEQVETADRKQLIKWYRFLREPAGREIRLEEEVVYAIVTKINSTFKDQLLKSGAEEYVIKAPARMIGESD